MEKTLILGFASKTGMALIEYFSRYNMPYSISDVKENVNLEFINNLMRKPDNIFLGKHTPEQLNGVSRIIISPGVSRNIDILKDAEKRGISVDSEISFALNILKNKKIKVVGITGTDGKSTTCKLTYEILKTTYNSYLLGNFGTPLVSMIDDIKDGDIVVLELSSYQLEDGEKYRINIATITNIAEDHLDRYISIDEYRKAKEKIFINQEDDDIAVINLDNEYSKIWGSLTRAKKIYFSTDRKTDIYINNSAIYYHDKEIVKLEDIKLKGEANLKNIMTAIGCSVELVPIELIRDTIKCFKGLYHRCEYVGTVNGITFINDSKATTVQAVNNALSVADNNIILILGGQDKNLDFKKLEINRNKDRIKAIICYGEAKDKIKNSLDFPLIKDTYKFDDAFNIAISIAKSGDTVVLSPGCTSFDQFTSYEERGKRFVDLVKEYESKI
ncbi:MAG TPA: UDP-N-acetylmuramoyl-L-alanine--D-glutamate ligase [Spirochaetota bacterium]|nr:UDP-N-acetylmuramoyl-L-alanine--D-glutamate ligase [Spirochaetota bacterium]HOM38584.1 UDP-N-acetylmuramoyl-L-alanine--D-glutamate ligase [Spirochaetota bacterium]HPQ49721.1 UDP-N-acetylmuramoyl-L-alanine--D-glutamate ligase [Spirochaetota bacterium]